MQYAAAEMFDDLPRGRARLPVRVLAGARSRRRPRSTSPGQRGHPRERRRDVRRARHRPRRSATWSGCATSCRSSASSRTTRSRCSTRSSSSTPGSFWSLLEEGGGVWGEPSESTVEKGEQFLQWGDRVGRQPRARHGRRCTTGLHRGTTAFGSRARDHDRDPRRRVHGRLARRELQRARRSGARQDGRLARSDRAAAVAELGRRRADRRSPDGAPRPGGRRRRHLPADAAAPRVGRGVASPPASTSSSRSRSR